MAPWHWAVVRGLDLSGNSDPRTGSGRSDANSTGTLSTKNLAKGSSARKLGSTFIPIVVYLAVCVLIFLFLRPRCKRVYAPRTIARLRYPEKPSLELPTGWLNWIVPFSKTPDIFVLHHGSIDGFFFLRFLKVLRNICLAGCLMIWPILLPIHATGGGGQLGLNSLTIGNVANPTKLYAHVFVTWAFFGFVIYTIVRECIYYVNLRQAYLSSPYYANRISSRTVLITGIPKTYLDEARLKKLYGDSARRVCIPHTSKTLANLVKEREQTAERLEKAEIELIVKTNKARTKHFKKHPESTTPPHIHEAGKEVRNQTAEKESKAELVTIQSGESDKSRPGSIRSRGGHLEVDLPGSTLYMGSNFGGFAASDDALDAGIEVKNEDDAEYMHPYGLVDSLPDVRGSVAAQWIPAEARPHHRPLGNYGRRVDTIRWTRTRLKQLNSQIHKLRRQIRRTGSDVLPAAFIEFDTQEAAQAAQQTLAHHRPLQMSTRILGIRPDEVLWASLRMSWWERIIRRFLVFTFVAFAVVFWAIPAAFVGLISNISFFSGIFFLRWIKHLPKPILGFLEGFIPPAALSLLMAVVPILLRWCAKQAGIPSRTMAELFTQKAYFIFQVVQVFLVTTLTAAASGSIVSIIKNPISAKDLLAANLPTASNFYLSYILIQCAASAGLGLLQIFPLLRHHVLARITVVPRARFKSWCTLRSPAWGGVFPVFTNMGVIALSYACIAPLVLLFAAGGVALTRIVWRYNLIYVLDSDMDSKGLFYPQALLHLIVGLYLAQGCLIGLFALHLAFGPVVLMLIFLIFTIIVHISLSDAIAPVLQNLPQTLSLEEEIREEEKMMAERAHAADRRAEEAMVSGAANTYYDTEQVFGDEEGGAEGRETEDEDIVTNDRALEGAGGVKAVFTDWLKSSTKSKLQNEVEKSGAIPIIEKLKFKIRKRTPEEPPSFLSKWLHPEEYEDFVALRSMIPPDSLPNIEYPDDYKDCDYMPPELWLPKPTLWIPRDDARVSRQEVAHTRVITPMTDRGAWLDEKGKVFVDFEASPLDKTRLLL